MRSSIVLLGRGRPPLGIEAAVLEATARGGVCLSSTYTTAQQSLTWKCAEGHVWAAKLNNVRSRASKVGSWCPRCAASKKRVRFQLVGLQLARREASVRGGECLDQADVEQQRHYRWRCSEGHEWWSSLRRVRHSGVWCPTCRKNRFLELAAGIASARGGQCLSIAYSGWKGPLKWRCKKGHEWLATLDSVRRNGAWCQKCYHDRLRLGIGAAIQLAEQHGGSCLFTEYMNAKVPLYWRCAYGHEWYAPLNHIKYSGLWCPQCASGRNTFGKSEQEIRNIFERIFPGRLFPTCRPHV